MATIEYMIHDVRLQVEQISVSRIFHCDTVPHALPRFHNPFSSLLVQFEKATGQPPTYFLWKMTHNMNSIKFSEAHLFGLLGTLGRLNGWLVKSSHWHLTSCHFAPSWIPTYFSASGLAVEMLPQACSKKKKRFSNQRGSVESFAWVLNFLWWSLSQLLLVIGDLKLYFGGRFVVQAPFETLQVMTQKAMDIEDIIKIDHLFHPMRQLQRRSGVFFVQSSRNQKTDKRCLPLNHVETCSRILRSTSHADDACIFIYRNGEIPFKIGLVWTTSEETDAGQTWGWKQLR